MLREAGSLASRQANEPQELLLDPAQLAVARNTARNLPLGLPRPAAIVSNFPQPAVLRLLPMRETLAQQYARWRRQRPLRDGAQGDRAYVATGGLHTFVRTQQRRRAYRQTRAQDEGVGGTQIPSCCGKLPRHNRSSAARVLLECWARQNGPL